MTTTVFGDVMSPPTAFLFRSQAGRGVWTNVHQRYVERLLSVESLELSSLRLVEPTAPDQKPAGSQKPEWEIRLYETTGTAGQVVLRLDRPVGRVRETNFLGEPTHELGKIATAGKEIRFAIRPWKIATLRVSPGE